VKAAVADVVREAPDMIERWQTFVSQDLPALNRELESAGIGKLEIKE
jgi:hypothetical protein